MFFGQVLWPVDDPEVLGTTALQGGLHQTLAAVSDEAQRLHHHAFAAGGDEVVPPGRGFGDRSHIVEPDAAVRCRGDQFDQEGRGAAILAALGVEHVRGAERQIDGVHAIGMLVQQVSEVARRTLGGRQREQHEAGTIG